MYIPENIKEAINEIKEYCALSPFCEYCELYGKEEKHCILLSYEPETWEPEEWED